MSNRTESKTVRKDEAAKGAEDTSSYKLNDPGQLAGNIAKLFEQGGKVMSTYLERSNGRTGPFSFMSEFNEASKIASGIAQYWMSDPAKLAEAQKSLFDGYTELWSRSMRRFLGEEVDPLVEPQAGDNRFKDDDWSQSQYFDFWKQAYLLTSNWTEELLSKTEGMDDTTKRKAEFYVAQLSSAMSPSNFLFTNPEVMRETLATNGENLVQGMTNFSYDLEHSNDVLRIRQTDLDAFKVGENLAITPGKVVFQNDIFQLIQYTPTTGQVYDRPLLMVPPWINKFYILDLVPEKSFIKFAVDQGFTVFVISWVNPDGKLAAKSFEDYMRDGILAATGKVIDITGKKKINALGYCVGGTLLATALAYMAETGDDRIKSVTFLATQVDFSEAGDLLVFIDDAQLNSLEEMMAEDGFLDGSRMATVFNMLRPKDLIWPYVVNNYLLGKKPFPFDLLYWNSDSTRMPAANHGFYLREFYYRNALAKGEMEIGGKKLDLSKIKLPVYELATREDHIAPAKSCYIGSRKLGGPVRFVVAGSGHIAGVVNPPEKKKYQHWIGEDDAPTLEAFLDKAEEHAGSWWPDWAKWLAKQSGEKIEPRQPGEGSHPPLEDAPGSYVKVRTV